MDRAILAAGISRSALWNRQKRCWEEPSEYRGDIMSTLHETRTGRFAMHALCSLRPLSRAVAWPQSLGRSKGHIKEFAEAHGIDAKDIEKSIAEFSSFDEFFIRRIKPESRPVDPSPEAVVSPSDGRVFALDELRNGGSFEVKGAEFCVSTLLGDPVFAKRFEGGSLSIVYLAPSDYHWFHYPVDARLFSSRIRGRRLYSVSDVSLQNGFRPFDFNYRCVNVLESEVVGTFAMVEVGAFYVGRLSQVDAEPGFKRKGAPKGYFGLGGSSVVLVFEPGRVVFDEDILQVSRAGRSALVRMGERIGVAGS